MTCANCGCDLDIYGIAGATVDDLNPLCEACYAEALSIADDNMEAVYE